MQIQTTRQDVHGIIQREGRFEASAQRTLRDASGPLPNDRTIGGLENDLPRVHWCMALMLARPARDATLGKPCHRGGRNTQHRELGQAFLSSNNAAHGVDRHCGPPAAWHWHKVAEGRLLAYPCRACPNSGIGGINKDRHESCLHRIEPAHSGQALLAKPRLQRSATTKRGGMMGATAAAHLYRESVR
jgi:hypothetical protein